MSGPTKQVPLAGGADRDRPPRAADARVDDREMDAGRRERDRVGEHGGAAADVVAADPVGEVDHLGPGAIRAITARQTPAKSSAIP